MAIVRARSGIKNISCLIYDGVFIVNSTPFTEFKNLLAISSYDLSKCGVVEIHYRFIIGKKKCRKMLNVF